MVKVLISYLHCLVFSSNDPSQYKKKRKKNIEPVTLCKCYPHTEYMLGKFKYQCLLGKLTVYTEEVNMKMKP